MVQAPHLSAVSMLFMFALSTGAALSQTTPGAPASAAASVEARNEKAYAAAIADCEGMWDRGTHMSRKEWSRTCRRVQARLKQMELR